MKTSLAACFAALLPVAALAADYTVNVTIPAITLDPTKPPQTFTGTIQLVPVPEPSPDPIPDPAPDPAVEFVASDPVKAVGPYSVKLRAAPGGAETGAEAVGSVGTVTAGPVDTAAGRWYAIAWPDGKAGWSLLAWNGITQLAPAIAEPVPEPTPEPEPEPAWRTVWAPANSDMARLFRSSRVTYDAAKSAVKVQAAGGVANSIAQYAWYVTGGKPIAAERARVSVEMFNQSGFSTKTTQNGKIAIGFWISDKYQGSGVGAGTLAANQRGATIRLQRPVTGTTRPQLAFYSYHLNRPCNGGADSATKCFGKGPRLKTPSGGDFIVPDNQWVRVVLDVQLNTVTNGVGNPDGWATFSVYSGGTLLASARLDNAIWRNRADWLIGGPHFTDMWGGGTGDDPPKTQAHWMRNYRIEVAN